MARDGIAALALALLGGAAIHQAGKLPYGMVRNPGPGFVPWWGGGPPPAPPLPPGPRPPRARRARGPGRAGAPARAEWRRVAALLAALVLYVVALEPLGSPLSTFLPGPPRPP